jgi:hypothetical protein
MSIRLIYEGQAANLDEVLHVIQRDAVLYSSSLAARDKACCLSIQQLTIQLEVRGAAQVR